MYVYMYTHMYACMCVCLYVCMYVCMSVCCMHACMHTCMYIRTYVRIKTPAVLGERAHVKPRAQDDDLVSGRAAERPDKNKSAWKVRITDRSIGSRGFLEAKFVCDFHGGRI